MPAILEYKTPEMSDSPTGSVPPSSSPKKRPIAPWGRLALWREERFLREQAEVRAYLHVVTPIGLRAEKLYREWREAVAEPVQDGQKAANASATFWWRITDGLRRFEALNPPAPAKKYHREFLEALRNGSLGSETAKNGFRSGKTYEVSRGLGYLDEFLKQLGAAERELGRLVIKYRLLDEPPEESQGENEAER